ncbi:MAG: flagellar basal body protein, partial [Candidatus Cybelea sp.]
MDGIAWAASAMVAARSRLEIATENLANVSTEGFCRIAARGFLTAASVTIAREPAPKQPAAPGDNGVDAIAEMVDVLAASRSFESAEKTVAAIDATRQKSADAARVK